ncbi:hypothetical protein ANCCAN_19440 [Ancylostoma caninum]|uniref:Uncharacterized protein n=1 Tax=Ancylostoma caninum TaxID=29170 RepID=A0A368FWQ8_ANCCA|nr:hypothetical protein ANCCAN_19440 [Ancylostoma caninum]
MGYSLHDCLRSTEHDRFQHPMPVFKSGTCFLFIGSSSQSMPPCIRTIFLVTKTDKIDTVVDAHELTAQVKNVKPLLQTPVKHAHTPLIQVCCLCDNLSD